jgi:hypothetical protein
MMRWELSGGTTIVTYRGGRVGNDGHCISMDGEWWYRLLLMLLMLLLLLL